MNAAILDRIEQFIKYYGLSVSSFADSIGVQRSSISHLLSGRNKPSLDFVLKLTKAYPDVDLYWLLYGQGDFPSTKTSEVSKSTKIQETIFSKVDRSKKQPTRVILFFEDGSFENYDLKTD